MGNENKLQTLNLSHNSFKEIPVGLSCLAPHLTRLHLSYNSLENLGPLARYPSSLKHLDLSHNQITSWHQDPDSDINCYSSAQVCLGFNNLIVKYLPYFKENFYPVISYFNLLLSFIKSVV